MLKSKSFKLDSRFKIGDTVNGYSIKKGLGEGRYGITYLGESPDGKLATIKQLKRGMLELSLEKSKYEPRILKELLLLNVDYFPKYIDDFEDKKRKGYILEYIEGETFAEILYKNKKVFNKEEIYKIALDLFNIIETLESINVVHKDIRVTNVIYTPSNEIKLIDFGLARYIDSKRYKPELDFWYIADFLIHLHYSGFKEDRMKLPFKKEIPWYDELDLSVKEKDLLMSLMGIGSKHYENIQDIKNDIKNIKF